MIHRIPANALQAGIYQILKESKYLDIPIYDHVDEETKLPYITFGEGKCTPNWNKTCSISDNQLHIEIWSEQRGLHEINDIADRVIYVLTSEKLIVNDYKVISIDVNDFDYGRGTDSNYFARGKSSDYWGDITLNIKLQYAVDYEGA